MRGTRASLPSSAPHLVQDDVAPFPLAQELAVELLRLRVPLKEAVPRQHHVERQPSPPPARSPRGLHPPLRPRTPPPPRRCRRWPALRCRAARGAPGASAPHGREKGRGREGGGGRRGGEGGKGEGEGGAMSLCQAAKSPEEGERGNKSHLHPPPPLRFRRINHREGTRHRLQGVR